MKEFSFHKITISHNKARKFLFDGKLSKRVGDLQTDKNNNFP